MVAADQTDAIVSLSIGLQHCQRAICRTIVHNNQLKIRKGLVQDAINRLSQIAIGVINRHDDRHSRGWVHQEYLGNGFTKATISNFQAPSLQGSACTARNP